MGAHDSLGLLGLIGLLVLVPFKFNIPPNTPGAGIRKLGARGATGLARIMGSSAGRRRRSEFSMGGRIGQVALVGSD